MAHLTIPVVKGQWHWSFPGGVICQMVRNKPKQNGRMVGHRYIMFGRGKAEEGNAGGAFVNDPLGGVGFSIRWLEKSCWRDKLSAAPVSTPGKIPSTKEGGGWRKKAAGCLPGSRWARPLPSMGWGAFLGHGNKLFRTVFFWSAGQNDPTCRLSLKSFGQTEF